MENEDMTQSSAAEQLPGQEPQPSEALETTATNAAEDELSRLREESAKIKDQALRALAEAENIRKRTQRELEDTAKYAIAGFARDLVGVVENLQLALAHIPQEARESNEMLKNLGQGVEMTMNELLRIFERNGIARINPVGEKFDHNFHQAVSQIENAELSPGTVMQVLQAGYIIHDRLLRPAMVIVSKAPPAPPPPVDIEA